MLAIALGIKLMSLKKCEDVYKDLGKLVFAEPIPKENEATTWREKLNQLYKSSSQSFHVAVHGSKVNLCSSSAASMILYKSSYVYFLNSYTLMIQHFEQPDNAWYL